ncbi:MAG: hypothetical protein CMJ77_09185 [Planctomycetaceae bacterium]|nr:hypothetical protein [Planctomycetaceae bacterium]
MKAMLEVFGANVTTSSSGVDALKPFASQSFDVVVTDLRMKGMDGVELIEKSGGQSDSNSLPWYRAGRKRAS